MGPPLPQSAPLTTHQCSFNGLSERNIKNEHGKEFRVLAMSLHLSLHLSLLPVL